MLNHHTATEEEKCEICSWQYAGEYALYNVDSYETMKKKQFGFANPKMYVEAFYDGEELIGFCNLFDDGEKVFFGIGVHPRHCGKGCGKAMIEIMCGISQALFPGKPLYLEVRTWNERAINCYKAAGFVVDGDVIHQKTAAGDGVFYRMVRKQGDNLADIQR